jgi:hypothetical protein
MARHLGRGVVLGEPGFDLGELEMRLAMILREGVSIDRNTLLCAPIPLCLMPRRSSAPVLKPGEPIKKMYGVYWVYGFA